MNPGTLPLPFVSLPPPPTYRYFTAQTPSIIPLACSKETKKPSPSNHLKYPHSRGEREPDITTTTTTTTTIPAYPAVSRLPPPPLLFPFFPPPALPSLSLSNPFHYPPRLFRIHSSQLLGVVRRRCRAQLLTIVRTPLGLFLWALAFALIIIIAIIIIYYFYLHQRLSPTYHILPPRYRLPLFVVCASSSTQSQPSPSFPFLSFLFSSFQNIRST